MEVSQVALARLLLYAVLSGGCLGSLYDLFRMTRLLCFGASCSPNTAAYLQSLRLRLPLLHPQKRRSEHRRALRFAVFFGDLLFCLIAGSVIVLLFFQFNSGKIRIPALICAAIGFVCYRMTLGRLTAIVFEWVAFLSETALRYAVFFLLFPFRRTAIALRRRICRIVRMHKSRVEAQARMRFTARETRRLTQHACGMTFGDIAPSDVEKNQGESKWKNKKRSNSA